MLIRFHSTNNINNITFKNNSSFLKEIATFKRDFGSTESVGRLQLFAQKVNITPDFLKQIEEATGNNKELLTFLKKILGLIPWK